ncbi:MAG: CAP domain-containing protein [Candidatus Thiodiazotropha sp.]
MEYDSHGCQGSQVSHYKNFIIGLSSLVGTALPLSGFAAAWLPQEVLVYELVNHQRAINNLNSLQQDDRLHAAAVGHSRSMADNGFFSHTTLNGNNGQRPGDRISDAGYNFSVGGENIAGGYGYIPTPLSQMEPSDAAHHVMYGTAELTDINAFFTNPADSWEDVGVGVSGAEWDAWFTHRNREGGWMGSRGHREMILSDLFDDIGVGYVWDPDDAAPILWDQGEIGFPLHTYWTQDFAAGDTVAPVPLPGAFWLLGSGLAGLVMLGHGRREAGSDIRFRG